MLILTELLLNGNMQEKISDFIPIKNDFSQNQILEPISGNLFDHLTMTYAAVKFNQITSAWSDLTPLVE